jgi:hypothetical protein
MRHLSHTEGDGGGKLATTANEVLSDDVIPYVITPLPR